MKNNKINRNNDGIKAGYVGLFANLLLSIGKMTIGLLSHSQAILADAINSLSDTMSSVITIVGFKISAKPADKEHPYGHERFEYIAGFVIALIMTYLGIDVLRSSFESVLNPQPIDVSPVTLIILGLSIVVKVFLAQYYKRKAIKIDSEVLHANAKDSTNDILMTGSILLAVIAQQFIPLNIDAYLGVILAIYIIVSGILMIRGFVNELMGVRPDDEVLNTIKTILDSRSDIFGYHDLLVHMYGQSTYASVHIEMNENTKLVDSHLIIDEIEREVKEKTNIQLVSHVDPLDLDSMAMKDVYNVIKTYFKNNYKDASFHDVRIIHERLMFDLVLNESYQKQYTEIYQGLEQTLKEHNMTYELEITVDTQQLI